MALLVAWILYFALHSLLAYPAVKLFFERSPFFSRNYRIIYNIVALVLLLPVVYFYKEETGRLIDVSTKLLGLAWLGVLAGVFVLWKALQQYDLNEFSGLTRLDNKEQVSILNTKGLNKWVRHPLYAGIFLIIWSFFFTNFSWAAFFTALAISAYLPVGIYLEEQKLIAVFGEEYQDYKKKVPMLFPWRKSRI